ncbi:hypothetical protein A5810_003035 [Enterococcus faecium]|uniref:Uncharacterized protein n=1 Tax=Enterococcus faecium TaxID=1352 RepID=A0A242AYV4_ENTFC|nr:hypothetical protein A5810_003035 [Enterococcus faecium]
MFLGSTLKFCKNRIPVYFERDKYKSEVVVK